MRFIDLCAGIGAGKLGLEANGLECVAHAEFDAKPERTYQLFYGTKTEDNFGDLMEIDTAQLPEADFLIAGFPCQTFSIMGQRKGFDDERGNIIYGIIKILQDKNIKYFLLENVKGLVNHDKGRTFRIIQEELDRAGYNVYSKVLNSVNYGVPQLRERIYIAGFRKDIDKYNFEFPKGREYEYNFDDFIDPDNNNYLNKNDATFLRYLGNKYNRNKYSIEEILTWNNIVIDTRQSDLRTYDSVFPTLRTGRHGLLYVKNGKIKKLNGYEALLIQGFPKEYAKKIKNNSKFANGHILSQAGNAMTVNVIEAISKSMINSKEKDFGVEQVCLEI